MMLTNQITTDRVTKLDMLQEALFDLIMNAEAEDQKILFKAYREWLEARGPRRKYNVLAGIFIEAIDEARQLVDEEDPVTARA